MPAGPIGSCWASGSWIDTAWVADSWGQGAVIDVGEQPSGGGTWVVTSTVAFDRRKMFFRQAVGESTAGILVDALGQGARSAQGQALSQALRVAATGEGRRRPLGSSVALGLTVKPDGSGVPEDLEGLLLEFARQHVLLTLIEK